MLNLLRKLIPERSWLRLSYHKLSAMVAAVYFGFPARKMKIIAVTGTSGKSTTCELIYHLLQSSGKKVGMISGIQFHLPSKTLPNESLRTTMRSWTTQKLLRQMRREACEFVVIEVSSHAIDQHRLWGIPVDRAVLTNMAQGEHLDYHDNFAEYVQTKIKLFRGVPFTVLNLDDTQYEVFTKVCKERLITYSRTKTADVMAKDIKLTAGKMGFGLQVGTENIEINVPLIGEHNLENVLAAIAGVQELGISLGDIRSALASFPGVPGRLEQIRGQDGLVVLVDHTYKPPALQAVLTTLKEITAGRLIVVWGGTGSRLPSFWSEAGKILQELADEIVLTTDDPYKDDPKKIVATVRHEIKRAEGDHFFEIPDRYEAIRYAIFIANKEDTVLVAGRGCEQEQTIGKKVIPFDDREVVREILGNIV
ncbi:UDP-N-acetylmuramoyl-L-alanyl-D-glutamate--2,6-diaminopimelate ligase [Candidatus Gracilibacteria bacterium]|nr:UDP-N-acetylmuramoyl-L-alanyl-D-glutamate--2,6-diaminopimelate ligase [Candidatus Gracilibacteria bacterium]